MIQAGILTQIPGLVVAPGTRPSRPPQETDNLIEDEDDIAIRENTPLNATTHIKIRITTIKINTPDKYHENRRKLKAFLI